MKYTNEIDIPKNTVMICQQVMKDTRLGKTTKTRLSVAYIYGLLRRTFNLSLNNIKDHFDQKYNIIYCINQVKTLEKRSGLGKSTVTYALKVLTANGYLRRYRNKIKHIIYINLPLVIKNHLLHPTKILNKYSGYENQTRRVQKVDPPRLKNKLRCNDSEVNDSKFSGYITGVNKLTNQNKKLIYSWGKNTKENLGFNEQVIKVIETYLLNNNKSYQEATRITEDINAAKKDINVKFKGIYSSRYYHNETNPYLYSKHFVSLLRITLENNRNLHKAITKDYYSYLVSNTNLKLRNSKNTRFSKYRRRPEIEKMPQWYYDQKNGENKNLKPTSPALQREIKQRLAKIGEY